MMIYRRCCRCGNCPCTCGCYRTIVRGATGATGATGPATITVGQTLTGAPGTVASVVNSGTAENAILTFTIPRGATGADGTSFTPAEAVEDTDTSGSATAQTVAATLNQLLANLRAAGILADS